MSKQSEIESILFVSSGALSMTKIVKKPEVKDLITKLKEKWNTPESGVQLIENGEEVQLMSSSENTEVVQAFLKDETSGELTKPALETLSIIAYRQPITKPELEQIRGVNCSLILRNLLLRGLVAEKEDSKRLQTVYCVAMDFIKLLGLESVEQLPDFEKLRQHEYVEDVVAGLKENKE